MKNMQPLNVDAIIPLSLDEIIQTNYASGITYDKSNKFDIEQAMELANLVRISYKDYENCESYQKSKTTKDIILKSGLYLKTDSLINQKRLKEYQISEVQTVESRKKEYEILDTFCYTSFHLWPPFIDFFNHNTSRFGFIAKDCSEKKASKNLYLIFRGTREAAEWMNNLQPHQIGVLTRNKDRSEWNKSLLTRERVHWGFHKIYSSFHPGPFWYRRFLFGLLDINFLFSLPGTIHRYLVCKKWSLKDNDKTKNISINEELDLNTINSSKSIIKIIEKTIIDELNNDSSISSIYISGHSLGAALATIATYHLAQKINHPIYLYSFASPRVGNDAFEQNLKEKTNVKCYRLANSEDSVPNVPPSSLIVNGLEMPKENIAISFIKQIGDKLVNFITGNIRNQPFTHIGIPIIFTCNTGRISSNHNMNATYSKVIEEAIDSKQNTNREA
ncbi:hypothetical protein [Microcystis sp. LEGE 00066]|uniref:lipase family protein n=1 Tax=Microcystis sp. LEGE 00066 TaxID=1828685 RepID=UPI001D1373C0|nr:hypothetical protein [Microcystis sp. LEGE 00066]